MQFLSTIKTRFFAKIAKNRVFRQFKNSNEQIYGVNNDEMQGIIQIKQIF